MKRNERKKTHAHVRARTKLQKKFEKFAAFARGPIDAVDCGAAEFVWTP